MHINVVLCASSAIRPKWCGPKSFRLYYGHPQLAGKRLVKAMQCTWFCAKSVKNDLKLTDFLKRNFYFETEGVWKHYFLSFILEWQRPFQMVSHKKL
jgi:hypothetical protein